MIFRISAPNRMPVLKHLYADDAKIYKVINDISDQAGLQAVVNTVKTWSDK